MMTLALLSFLAAPAAAEELQGQDGNRVALDTMWVVMAAALVFFMQAGFLAFEIGMVRIKNTTVTAFKNLADWVLVSVLYFLVGFGLMFGTSIGGVIGSDLFAGQGILLSSSAVGSATHLGWAFVLFQLAFCGTAVTIVSGAMAERSALISYLMVGAALGAFIYPVFGHWAWGGGYLGEDNVGWLQSLGYRDFAGSSVVHMVGGFAALVGIKLVGPRMGRFDRHGRMQPMRANSKAWSAFGVLLLWFGWFGFNGGSTLGATSEVAGIVLNTCLAAAMAGIAGLVHCVFLQKKNFIEDKVLGSVLGGLVAITACCDVVTPMRALMIGAVAGVVHNWSFDLVSKKLQLDDVVGAVSVHGACGAWGCLAVGIFGRSSYLPLPRFEQIGVQALGVVVCVVWTIVGTYVALKALSALGVKLRVDPMHELRGLSLSTQHEDVPLEPEDAKDDVPDVPQGEVREMLEQIRSRVQGPDVPSGQST